jgi:dihydrodipicolinate synthase/N-acetylneuraminate lyase
MDRHDVTWRGYWPACPTPFDAQGRFDPAVQRALLDFYLGEGMHGLLINGTSGEWFSQTAQERRQVAENALAHVAGRVPVVIGCTANTAREVAELARHAIDHGAAGVAATPPPYAKTYEDETVQYYRDIAEAVPDAPLMIYNWPHGTSVDIGPALANRLVEIETVVAVKDSTPNAQQFYETARTVVDRALVFGPFMSVAGYEALCAGGGDGFIGGGSLLGRLDPEFWEAHWRGETDACRAQAERADRLFPKLWLPGGWGGLYGAYQSQLKALMAMLGQPGGHVRPPRLPVTDPDKLAALRQVLVEEGLLQGDAAAAPA